LPTTLADVAIQRFDAARWRCDEAEKSKLVAKILAQVDKQSGETAWLRSASLRLRTCHRQAVV